MATLDTEILVIGSGAGGAVTAATLARAGRTVTVVEEGPWVDPDATEPFSLEEMVAKYRHGGSCAALGRPAIAYAEGRCVGGSTEINSGLYHRLPAELAEEWQRVYRIDEFGADALDHYSERIEEELAVSRLPGAPPMSSAVLERGAAKLGWQAVEFSRVFRYESNGRAVKQTMARTLLPRAMEAGARDRRLSRVEVVASRRPHRRRTVRAPTPRRIDRATRHPRRPRLRLRGRDADTRAAAAQRYPPEHRQRAQDASDGEDRGALRSSDRPRRRAHAPRHRVRPRAHHRRIGEPPRSRRTRARRLRFGLRRGARRLGTRRGVLRRHPQRGPRARAGASRSARAARDVQPPKAT